MDKSAMGRPPGKVTRDKKVEAKVTETEQRMIAQHAASLCITISDFVRKVVLEAIAK